MAFSFDIEQAERETGFGEEAGREPEGASEGAAPTAVSPRLIDLNVSLSREELEDLGARLHYEITRYNAFVEPRRSNLEQWRRDWELFPTGRSTRWRGASDIPSPLVHIYVNNHHTRLNQQIAKAVPPFTVVPKSGRAVAYAGEIEEALTSRLEDADWEAAADAVHLELPLAGNVGLRVTYEQEVRTVPRYKMEVDEAYYETLLAAGREPLDAFWEAVARHEDGEPKMYLEWSREEIYSGVRFKVIPWEDFIILPITIRDPEDCYGIGERLMIRGDELLRGAKTGKYIAEAVDRVLEYCSGMQGIPRDRLERYDVQGIAVQSYGSHGGLQRQPVYEDFLCYELCWKMDVNNDGDLEWVIVTLHYPTKTILRCQHLPYEHGEAYYHLFRYFPRVREIFGMGVAEKMAPFQDGSTAVLNQIIDHADLALNLFGNFFYDASSGFDPSKFELQLGRPIKVDSIEGIRQIDIQPLPAEHYQIYQLFKEIGDLITASSNPTLGRVAETTKTLGEVQLVAASAGMQFEEVASRVARTWAKVWDQVRKLEAQYAIDGMIRFRRKITVDGEVINEIPREVLLEEVKLVPTGLKQLADMQSRVQQATIVQNTLLQHPLTATNIEVLVSALDVYLQSVNYPQREKIMEAVYKAINAQRAISAQQMAAELAGQQAMGLEGALQPGPVPGEGEGEGEEEVIPETLIEPVSPEEEMWRGERTPEGVPPPEGGQPAF
ncbi:MAG: portal protein [bacterium JZ-2024 1]